MIGRIIGMPGVCDTKRHLRAPKKFFYSSDVEIHHLETAQQLEFTDITVVSQGPLRAAVKAQIRYGQSLISVTVKSTLATSLAIK